MQVTHQQALVKINAAIAEGVEADWQDDVAAVIKYLSETEGEMTDNNCGCSNPITANKLRAAVLKHTGVMICEEVAFACSDIATA